MSEGRFGAETEGGERFPPGTRFGAGRALLVLFAWIGGQLVGGFLGAVSGTIYLMSLGEELGEASSIEDHLVELMTPALAVGTIVGAACMVAAAVMLAKPHIREVGATGIGWSRGPWRPVLLGALFGAVISSVFVMGIALLEPEIVEAELGPIARLAEQSERIRWIWALIAVAIAPATEEFLFRGVLFSGFAKSWGIPASAAFVSLLFLLFHLAETMAYWPATVAVGLLTIGTITSRLQTNRLGPPIAMHLAYNTVLAIALLAGK